MNLKNINFIVKTVNEYDKSNYENVVYTDRADKEHLKVCKNVLAKTDILVGVMEGTFELMAQIMDIPVIIADVWKPKPFNGDD